jgi:hypothetical protein
MPDMIVASTTATQEEIDHSVSANWRDPIAPKAPEQKVAPVAEGEAEVKEETETPAATQETEQAEIESVHVAVTNRPRGPGS